MATDSNNSDSSKNELSKAVEKALPFFETHGNTLLLGVAAVLAVAAGLIFASKWSAVGGDEEGWAMMSAARATEDYANIAEKYPGTDVGMWATLIEADSYQQSAMQLSFTDREASRKELERSKKQYDTLLKMSLSPEVEEKALYGMAKCTEASCDGDTAAAIAAYQAVLTKFPESSYKETIESRVAELSKPETKEFYTFWSTQDPKPGDLRSPQDSGASPFGNQSISLPDTPLILQESGFNPPVKVMPQIPDFEPVEGTTPITPLLKSDSDDTAPEIKQDTPKPADKSETPAEPASEEPAESAAETTPESSEKPAAEPKPEAVKPEDVKPEEATPADPPADDATTSEAAAESKPETVTEDAKPETAKDGDSKSE